MSDQDIEAIARTAIAASGALGLLFALVRFVILQDRKDDVRDRQYAEAFTDRLRKELALVYAALDVERAARRDETRRCDRLERALRAANIPIPEEP